MLLVFHIIKPAAPRENKIDFVHRHTTCHVTRLSYV